MDPYGTEGPINDTIFSATTFDAEKDNPYELSGFKSITPLNARELTDGEVHAAFRKVSRTLHPDKTGGGSAEDMIRAKEAADFLTRANNTQRTLAEKRWLVKPDDKEDPGGLNRRVDKSVLPGIALLQSELHKALQSRYRNVGKSQTTFCNSTAIQAAYRAHLDLEEIRATSYRLEKGRDKEEQRTEIIGRSEASVTQCLFEFF